MNTPQLIQTAFDALAKALEELEAKQTTLWAESDRIKDDGGDWVPANHAGNECGSAAANLKIQLISLKTHLGYIPKMLAKHKISDS